MNRGRIDRMPEITRTPAQFVEHANLILQGSINRLEWIQVADIPTIMTPNQRPELSVALIHDCADEMVQIGKQNNGLEFRLKFPWWADDLPVTIELGDLNYELRQLAVKVRNNARDLIYNPKYNPDEILTTASQISEFNNKLRDFASRLPAALPLTAEDGGDPDWWKHCEPEGFLPC